MTIMGRILNGASICRNSHLFFFFFSSLFSSEKKRRDSSLFQDRFLLSYYYLLFFFFQGDFILCVFTPGSDQSIR